MPVARNNAPYPTATTGGIFRETLAAVAHVWFQTRLLRRRTDITVLLPPVATVDAGCVDALGLLRQVDRFVRALVFWTGSRRCFYRSFAAAVLLRRRGVAAGIDFGLRIVESRRRQCHCWVTVGGEPLGEEPDPRVSFPVAAGSWGETVRYWIAADDAGGER